MCDATLHSKKEKHSEAEYKVVEDSSSGDSFSLKIKEHKESEAVSRDEEEGQKAAKTLWNIFGFHLDGSFPLLHDRKVSSRESSSTSKESPHTSKEKIKSNLFSKLGWMKERSKEVKDLPASEASIETSSDQGMAGSEVLLIPLKSGRDEPEVRTVVSSPDLTPNEQGPSHSLPSRGSSNDKRKASFSSLVPIAEENVQLPEEPIPAESPLKENTSMEQRCNKHNLQKDKCASTLSSKEDIIQSEGKKVLPSNLEMMKGSQSDTVQYSHSDIGPSPEVFLPRRSDVPSTASRNETAANLSGQKHKGLQRAVSSESRTFKQRRDPTISIRHSTSKILTGRTNMAWSEHSRTKLTEHLELQGRSLSSSQVSHSKEMEGKSESTHTYTSFSTLLRHQQLSNPIVVQVEERLGSFDAYYARKTDTVVLCPKSHPSIAKIIGDKMRRAGLLISHSTTALGSSENIRAATKGVCRSGASKFRGQVDSLRDLLGLEVSQVRVQYQPSRRTAPARVLILKEGMNRRWTKKEKRSSQDRIVRWNKYMPEFLFYESVIQKTFSVEESSGDDHDLSPSLICVC